MTTASLASHDLRNTAHRLSGSASSLAKALNARMAASSAARADYLAMWGYAWEPLPIVSVDVASRPERPIPVTSCTVLDLGMLEELGVTVAYL